MKLKHTSRAARRAAWVREFKAACAEIWRTRPHLCEDCGAYLPEPAIVDYFHHIKLRSQGGGNELNNIALLCRKCHGARHGRKIIY